MQGAPTETISVPFPTSPTSCFRFYFNRHPECLGVVFLPSPQFVARNTDTDARNRREREREKGTLASREREREAGECKKGQNAQIRVSRNARMHAAVCHLRNETQDRPEKIRLRPSLGRATRATERARETHIPQRETGKRRGGGIHRFPCHTHVVT